MYLYLVYLNQLKHEIFKHRYPRFSYFCFCIFVLIILLYNPAQILGFILATFLVMLAINNPMFRKFINPIMNRYFFRDDLLNPYARYSAKNLKELEDENVMKNTYKANVKDAGTGEAKKAAKLKKKDIAASRKSTSQSSTLSATCAIS